MTSPTPKTGKIMMMMSAVAVALVMMAATHLLLREMRQEATRQASRQLESSMLAFWELMGRKGSNFRVEGGQLYVGDYYVLNGNYEMPDKIFSITGSRATVFQGDTRVATNVPLPDGSRAVGTRLTGPAYRAVFGEGIRYRGKADILGIPYFTAYDPIRDRQGKVIGALFVGVRQSEYLARYDRINLKIRAINGTLAGIFLLFAFLLLAERKRAQDAIQRQLNFLQVLYDTAPIPIFSRDAAGRYTGCNRTFESFVGLARDKVIGKTVHDVWPREFADLIREKDLELMGESGVQSYESVIRDAGGTRRDVVFARAALRDPGGASDGLVGVILDVTERKAAELERQKLELQRLQARMMESLMAKLSHDLKTPLTPLFALLPLAVRTAEDPKLRRMLEICQSCVRQIDGLAAKSLELVRLSSESLRTTLLPIPLSRPVEAARSELQACFGERGVTAVNLVEPGLAVLGDEGQLLVLFRNLLTNAARYAAAGGTVAIGAAAENGTVTAYVRDDGVGLDPEHTALIFGEFFKVDQARQDLDTQGLGLAICQRIAANHRGRIWAESAGKGRGTTIALTLLAAPTPEGDTEGGPEREAGRGKTT